ncbi:hypothetical protein [Sphingomonas sp.]|uniref:hypothetical protein n=1 Tax=Sphingomonas sp. TaxID=28214 RepID=UPI0031E2283B
MRVLIELFYIVLGLAAALVMTWAAAWAYPLGRAEIWWCGIGAMVATVAMGVGPLHRARIADRMARRHSEQ